MKKFKKIFLWETTEFSLENYLNRKLLHETKNINVNILWVYGRKRKQFTKIEKLTDFYNLEFEIPQEQTKYVVHKGSITINGISLTVAEINQNRFKVAIIPHTFENTNLKALNVGDNVNIETDILGKVKGIFSK